MAQQRLEPKDRYVALLAGMQKREKEILFCSDDERNKRRNAYNRSIKDVSDPLFNRWSRLYGGFMRRSALTESEIELLSSSANELIPAYHYINSLVPPLYAEQEIEVRRLTTVSVECYRWLSTFKHLNESRLELFQTIDELLYCRAYVLMSGHLWREDQVELDEIIQVIDLDVTKKHGHLIAGEEVEFGDGWLIDRSAALCQQQQRVIV
jgi:hypothetical protein